MTLPYLCPLLSVVLPTVAAPVAVMLAVFVCSSLLLYNTPSYHRLYDKLHTYSIGMHGTAVDKSTRRRMDKRNMVQGGQASSNHNTCSSTTKETISSTVATAEPTNRTSIRAVRHNNHSREKPAPAIYTTFSDISPRNTTNHNSNSTSTNNGEQG